MNKEELKRKVEEYETDFEKRSAKLREPDGGDLSSGSEEYQHIRSKYAAAMKNKQRAVGLAQARLAGLEQEYNDYTRRIFEISQNFTAETASERSKLMYERNQVQAEIEKAKLALSTAEAGGEEVFKEIIDKF
ncbi:MAG: hypothetical protein PHC38_06480 [Weeksellaceae bacterium]|nr:hypothetical protein [Weeksellaceae bacterium]